MRININLRDLLSPQKAAELSSSIGIAKATGTARLVGVWCGVTGAAVMAEVHAGDVQRWHISGPLGLDEAREFLGVAESD